MTGSHWESNPGHLWLEPPVLCYWVMTAGQSPTLTILYMYIVRVGGCPQFDSQWLPAFSLSSIFRLITEIHVFPVWGKILWQLKPKFFRQMCKITCHVRRLEIVLSMKHKMASISSFILSSSTSSFLPPPLIDGFPTRKHSCWLKAGQKCNTYKSREVVSM